MKEWTAPELLSLASAHWNTSLLQAGIRLDLFTTLGRRPMNGEDLAETLGCDSRALSMLLAAMTACGLVFADAALSPQASAAGVHDGPVADPAGPPASFADCLSVAYSVAPSVRKYLSKDSPDYLGFIIQHHHHLQPAWHRLDEAVKTGESLRSSSAATRDDEEREAFLMGMFNVASQQAEGVAAALDLSGRTRLLDLGGGPGTYAVYFCLANPQLRATIFDKPTTRPYAEAVIRRFGLEERIDFAGGDFFDDPLPQGYDAVWLSQILHGTPPDEAREVVARAARVLVPGGLIAVQEFMLDDTLDGPLFSAQFSLNMLLGTDGGQAFTRSEIAAMLRSAGALDLRWVVPPLPPGCAIMRGRVG